LTRSTPEGTLSGKILAGIDTVDPREGTPAGEILAGIDTVDSREDPSREKLRQPLKTQKLGQDRITAAQVTALRFVMDVFAVP